MLCANNYAKEYIDACRTRVASQVAAYASLIAAARKGPGPESALLDRAIERFEPDFFGNLVLALESYFVHRREARKARTATRSMKYGCSALP